MVVKIIIINLKKSIEVTQTSKDKWKKSCKKCHWDTFFKENESMASFDDLIQPHFPTEHT